MGRSSICKARQRRWSLMTGSEQRSKSELRAKGKLPRRRSTQRGSWTDGQFGARFSRSLDAPALRIVLTPKERRRTWSAFRSRRFLPAELFSFQGNVDWISEGFSRNLQLLRFETLGLHFELQGAHVDRRKHGNTPC